jgi:microcin C transport system ATP-binding protein
MLRQVGLDASILGRYPHEFSGGQRQRIAIARVAVLRPELLVLDEPTSALDATVQQQVLRLLVELQRRLGMSYLFISHDLAVIQAIAHRVIVMKDGVVVEHGETADILHRPTHPYTRRLIEASL